MKRLIPFVLVFALGASLVQQASAARRVVVRHGPRRTTVVVHRGWPLSRPARVVVVNPSVVAVRVQPRVYLRPVVWTSMAVAVAASHPSADALSWVDGAALSQDDDWTELTLNCGRRGTRRRLGLRDPYVDSLSELQVTLLGRLRATAADDPGRVRLLRRLPARRRSTSCSCSTACGPIRSRRRRRQTFGGCARRA